MRNGRALRAVRDEAAAPSRIPSRRYTRIALDAARRFGALPCARRADHRLFDSGLDLQQRRHPQPQSERRGRRSLPDVPDLCAGDRLSPGGQRCGAFRGYDQRHARRPFGRRDCGHLHPREFRARSDRAGTTQDRRPLQPTIFHSGQHRRRRDIQRHCGGHRDAAALIAREAADTHRDRWWWSNMS